MSSDNFCNDLNECADDVIQTNSGFYSEILDKEVTFSSLNVSSTPVMHDVLSTDIDNESLSCKDEEYDTFHLLRQYKSANAKCLIVSYLNINGILNKFSEMSVVMNDELVDIMAIAETKLDETVRDNIIHVKNYKMYRCDGSRVAHGLMVYIRSDITHCRRYDLDSNGELESQYIVIEVWLKKQRWFFVAVYKPPPIKNESFINELSNLSEKMLTESSDILLLGDMNINMLLSNNKLNDFCGIYGFKNMVKEPTCFKSITNESLIDVILVSKPQRFNESMVFDTGLSDCHKMVNISTKLHAPKREPRKIMYRSFKKFDEAAFKKDVECIPFHIAHVFDDINEVAWCHEKLFLDVIDSHAPIKRKTLKKDSVPFMNSEWRKVIHRRNQLRNRFHKNKSQYNWNEYRKMRNLATKLRRQSEINYFRERSMNVNVTDFWKTFKPYLSSKSNGMNDNIILKENDQVITKPEEVCKVFKSYYESIAENIGAPDNFESDVNSESILSAVNIHSNHPSIKCINSLFPSPNTFEFSKVTPDEVLKSMKRVNVKKAKGYDNVSPYFIKIAAYQLATPVSQIVNMCITESTYPDVYKMNEITPIYKSKDTFNKANYRPVSCSVSISKIIEYHFASQLRCHFDNYFHDKLCAYRTGTGCEHVIVNIIEDLKKALDDDMIVGTLLMDLSKAFDCLPHKLLVAKLNAYGLNVSACRLIASYLANRKQRVKYYGMTSDWSISKKGIPQGSVLGPLMYNVFVNDLLYAITENIYNYADDNTIAVIGTNLPDVLHRLESTTRECIDWFVNNMMKANPEKFQLIIFNRKTEFNDITLNVNGICLENVKSVKLLGIHINVRLDFSEHIEMLCKKASRNLKVLLRLSKQLKDSPDRFMVVETFLMSCFNYCPIVWHFCNKSLSLRMEKLYERGIRFATKDYVSEYTDLLNKNEKCTFMLTRLKKISIFVYNCVQNLYAKHFNQMYSIKNNEYAMRDNMVVNIPKFKTIRFGKMSLNYSGSKLWNSLPVNYKECQDISKFKVKLNCWKCSEKHCMKCADFMFHT